MRILQLIDSLQAGGAERMAVNYANALSKRGHQVHLWATRAGGPLVHALEASVQYRCLDRRGPIGFRALWQASRDVKKHKIELIHAHSTSFFFGTLLKLLHPKLRLVWHDHYGSSEHLANRKSFFIRRCSRYFDAIISVNEILKNWALTNLSCNSVCYIKNFIVFRNDFNASTVKLYAEDTQKIICVANIRPQKNHFVLLDAFFSLSKKYPNWSLHLVGKHWNDKHFERIQAKLNLYSKEKIFYYGTQEKVSSLISQAQIGVLSSNSEGLPLALLEYAMAGLAVVCTDVGQCREVVQNNALLVPPKQPKAFAQALETYMLNPDKRISDAQQLQQHIRENYSEQAVMDRVLELYQSL